MAVREEIQDVLRALQTQIRLLDSFGLRSVKAAAQPDEPEKVLDDFMLDSNRDPGLELDALKARLGQCTRCPLSAGRKNIVFGQGATDASLVLVGEGPGQEEDRTGEPFVGEAGQLLDKILRAMGLSREQVYICNVVKCRPPKNRAPNDDEMTVCGKFLNEQLAIIKPRYILSLGSTATKFILGSDKSIGRMRGRFFTHEPTGAKVMPTYHPAYLLRNESAKRPVWDDVRQVMADLKTDLNTIEEI